MLYFSPALNVTVQMSSMVSEEIHLSSIGKYNDFSINICPGIISLSIQEDFETETTA